MRIRHIVTAVVLAVLALAATGVAILMHPQPAFAYHVQSWRLSLFSDKPFDTEKSKSLLAEVDRRLRLASLDHGDGEHRIFVANSYWRARLVFLWNFGVGGVNYYPLTRNVFIRESDIDNDPSSARPDRWLRHARLLTTRRMRSRIVLRVKRPAP